MEFCQRPGSGDPFFHELYSAKNRKVTEINDGHAEVHAKKPLVVKQRSSGALGISLGKTAPHPWPFCLKNREQGRSRGE